MSVRTFARHFRHETGTTPLQWLLSQRIAAAQHLLETTRLPVETIAHRCGFTSAAHLRKHFGRRIATTPGTYRTTFALSPDPVMPVQPVGHAASARASQARTRAAN